MTEPHWKEDFPIAWERDHYITRRELVKFMTLGSGLLVGANFIIVATGGDARVQLGPQRRIAGLADVPQGHSMLFRYPTGDDPCILIRSNDGSLAAYSQVCTHLTCAVVHRPQQNDLFCPCHRGFFAVKDGRPVAGPPTRPLPRILLEMRGQEIYAVGVEV